jgi:photosystem II stability/assembly factor-like uncharacterized protein
MLLSITMRSLYVILSLSFYLSTLLCHAQWEWQNPLPQDEYQVIGGFMLKTTNAGYTWIQQNTGYDDHYVNSVFFTDEDKGWAAANSLVLKTDDGGDHWTKVYTDQSLWQSVYFPDEFNGYVTGTYGMIAKTTDGGDSWTTQESNTDVYLYEVFFSGYNAG